MEKIYTDKAPAAIGPYSQAIIEGGLVFASGQTPLVPETGVMVEGGIEEQTERVLLNLAAVLEAAGTNLSRVIKATCFLRSMEDFARFNEVYERQFNGHKPARSCIAAAGLPKNALVEIEVIAAL